MLSIAWPYQGSFFFLTLYIHFHSEKATITGRNIFAIIIYEQKRPLSELLTVYGIDHGLKLLGPKLLRLGMGETSDSIALIHRHVVDSLG